MVFPSSTFCFVWLYLGNFQSGETKKYLYSAIFLFFLSYILFYIIIIIIWLCCTTCGILLPQPGIEPVPPAVEMWSLNHRATKEVPTLPFFIESTPESCLKPKLGYAILLLKILPWFPIVLRIKPKLLTLAYKALHDLTPPDLCNSILCHSLPRHSCPTHTGLLLLLSHPKLPPISGPVPGMLILYALCGELLIPQVSDERSPP